MESSSKLQFYIFYVSLVGLFSGPNHIKIQCKFCLFKLLGRLFHLDYKLIYFILAAISELKKKFHCVYSSVMSHCSRSTSIFSLSI